MWTQTVFKLIAIALMGGIVCGALWDVFKIPQIVFCFGNGKATNILRIFVTFVSDVTFCLVCGCVAILAFYYGNEGNMRGVAFVLMAVGFWAYRVSLGAFICFLAKRICRAFKKTSSVLVNRIKKICVRIRKIKIKEE